jgi:hypothetical protein
MGNLLKTGSWTAAIAGFLFVGADLYAQGRGFARAPVGNAQAFRQQNFARPFTPAMQTNGFNTNFLAQQNMARSFSPATQPVFNANLFRQQSLTRPFIPSTQPLAFNNAFTNNGFANFNRTGFFNPFLANTNFNRTGFYNPYATGFYNPYATGYYNPYLGNGVVNPAGFYNPYLNPTYAQGGFYNPYAGNTFNPTGFFNPYAFPGSIPQPAPFATPFFGY